MTDCKKKYRNQFVKAAYLSMAISLVLSVSCATMSEKRYVENNTFISTYPKMAIKVSPEFEYVGEYHGDIFRKATFDMDMRDHKYERTLYIFCEKGSDGSVKRGITIFTNKLPERVHWISEPFTSEKVKSRAIDTGDIEVAGMNWRYAMWATKNFFGFAKDFVHNAGYSTTNQHLVFAIGKIITHEKDTLMFLYYIEDLRDSGFPNTTFEGKKEFLDEFFQRGLSTVQFLKSDTTPEKAMSGPKAINRTSEKPGIRTQEKRLTYIPKEVKSAKTSMIKLRSTPKLLWESDIENMIGKYNFFVKRKNEIGYFPNDFVDNSDGTVTDRVTGLMWEKGGSPSAMRYWSAKRYISRLNKEKFLGYNDWRIPTAEELATLIERERNDRGLHIAPVFDDMQKACWSSDTFGSQYRGNKNNVIDFSEGTIDDKISRHAWTWIEDQCFIRAVRSIK